MTRDEILNMPAGRDMDAFIAEKVMGWEVEMGTIAGDYYKKKFGYSVPEYSTRIIAAWDVVEKMKLSLIPIENKWFCGLWDDDYFDVGLGCIDGYFGGGYTGMDDIRCIADTAPLAICRAALLAVLED